MWRRYRDDGIIDFDTLSAEDDTQPGEPLIVPVMRAGRRLLPQQTLAEIRTRAERNLASLPEALRRLDKGVCLTVNVGAKLVQLAAAVDRRLANR